jgi:hypothetical protein
VDELRAITGKKKKKNITFIIGVSGIGKTEVVLEVILSTSYSPSLSSSISLSNLLRWYKPSLPTKLSSPPRPSNIQTCLIIA